MKEKIDLIFSDLKNEVITEREAHNKVLLLFNVIKSVCDCRHHKLLNELEANKCSNCSKAIY
ncbi:MAG: hypothetical protein AABY22_35280 [Nanoarchaeota archaeon]